MGYLIAGHFLKQRPVSSNIRAALPDSVGFVVYQHQVHAVYAIDTFRASKPSSFPFSAATPATDIPLTLSPELQALYEQLRAENAANGFKRAYVNLAGALSRSLGAEVLSVYADDDGNDFACLSRNGEVVSGVARCEAHIVRFGPDGASRSLASDEDEPELHRLAADAVTAFTGVPASDMGFGTMDPPENMGFRAIDG
jgi:hypothetical protein